MGKGLKKKKKKKTKSLLVGQIQWDMLYLASQQKNKK